MDSLKSFGFNIAGLSTFDIAGLSTIDLFQSQCDLDLSNEVKIPQSIKRLNLTGEQRYKVATIVAGQSRYGISSSIRSYCLNNDQNFEIAKIAVVQNPMNISQYITDYCLTQDQRYSIAQMVAERDGFNDFFNINEYELTQDQRYSIAEIVAAKSGWKIFKDIKRYGDLTENQKNKIIFVCLIKDKLNVPVDSDLQQSWVSHLNNINLENLTEEQKESVKYLHAYICIICKRVPTIAEEKTIKELVDIRIVDQKKLLWDLFVSGIADPRYVKFFNNQPNPPAHLCRIIITKWSLSEQDPSKTSGAISEYLQENSKRVFKDKLGITKDLLSTLMALLRSGISDQEKLSIIDKIRSFKLDTETSKQNLRQFLSIVGCFVLIKEEKNILGKGLEECKILLDQYLLRIFCLEQADVEELISKYWDLEEKMRIPSALITYLSPLLTLNNIELNGIIREFSKSILNGTIQKDRYNPAKSTHLLTLSELHRDVFENWQKGSERPVEEGGGRFSIVDTDDWQDLFLSGTEVYGSCQNIYNFPTSSRHLIGNVIDGKNRMVAVVEKNTGKIVARSIIRLLFIKDSGSPAILQERIYLSHEQSVLIKGAINGFVREKGSALGVRVFRSNRSIEERFALKSHGCPFNASQYSDALEDTTLGGADGTSENGCFTVSCYQVDDESSF